MASLMLGKAVETITFGKDIQSITYYVAGAIARSLLKNIKCECCPEFLSAGQMETKDITFEDCLTEEEITAKEEFIARVSRGGLLKPSDAVYVACLHAYATYDAVKSNEDAFNYLVSASNPRSVFTKYFMDHAKDSNSLESVLETACKKQHLLSSCSVCSF